MVGLLVVWGGVCHRAGRQAAELEADRRIVAAVAAEQTRARQAAAIAARIGGDHETIRTEIRTRTRTLERLVPQYVPADADRACVVPRGFVQLYDAAAAGQPPAPAAGAAGDPADVALSEVADVSVEAFGVCHELRASVLAWQAWYRETAALYGQPPPAEPLY